MFYEKSGDGIGVGLHKVSSQTKHVSVNTEEISDEVAGDEGAETSCRTPITSARNTLPFIYVRKSKATCIKVCTQHSSFQNV